MQVSNSKKELLLVFDESILSGLSLSAGIVMHRGPERLEVAKDLYRGLLFGCEGKLGKEHPHYLLNLHSFLFLLIVQKIFEVAEALS